MRTMMGQQGLVTIAEGDYVIRFGKITAAWPGWPFRGYNIPAGDYECDVAFMYRFQDGRIAERWAVRDDLAMIEQLSGTPAPLATARWQTPGDDERALRDPCRGV